MNTSQSSSSLQPEAAPSWWLFTAIIIITLIMVIVASFLSKEERPSATAAPPSPEYRRLVDPPPEIVFPLLGNDEAGNPILSEVQFDLGAVRPGWGFLFEGPPEARVHFGDGTSGPISRYFGTKRTVMRFSGPRGRAVKVRFYRL